MPSEVIRVRTLLGTLMRSRSRSYQELILLPTLQERFAYLQLGGGVGHATFGYERWLNQDFYRSREWKTARRDAIVRDLGRDLAVEGYDVHDRVFVHHMNPMTIEMIEEGHDDLVNLDNLITTSHRTHNAIHYGDESQLPRVFVPRSAGDHIPWR